MLTPKLSEVIFFFLVLSATPGPAEPRVPGGPLVPPIIDPDKGKTLFLKCSSMYYFYIKVEFTQYYTKIYCPQFFCHLKKTITKNKEPRLLTLSHGCH